MKLTHVAVEGCGRFGTPARIEGLGPGVNILSARNEAGKSTLFRAIRTCLFERHNTTREEVKKLATEGASLPLKVAIGFEHEGKTYELTKSFLRGASALLTCGGIEIAKARAADETVWELLGIKPDNKVDQAAYGVLWVEQGQSFHVPEPSEAAANALNDVIQQEVGTLVGGERARSLLATVKDELSKLVTDTRRPRTNGPLDLAMKEHEKVAVELLDVEARLGDLDQSLETLAQLRGDLKRNNNPADVQKLKRELADAQQQLKAAEDAAALLQRHVAEEREAHERLKGQDDKLAQLRQRAQRIDENRSRINVLSAALAPLDEQESEARRRLGEAASRRDGLDGAAAALDANERQLQRLAAIVQKSSTRDALARRLESLRAFEAKLSRNEADLKVATVDDAAIKELDVIERDDAMLRARIDAAAARLTIEGKPGSQVAMNGMAVSGNMVRAVSEPLIITVGEDVVITVSPPASTLAAAETTLDELRGKLKALLARHDAASAADLRRLRNDRMALEEQARELRAERSALALKEASPLAEIQRLGNDIGQIDAETERLLRETGAASLPAAEEIEAGKSALIEKRGELRAARAACEAIVSGQNDVLARIAKERGSLGGQKQEIEAQLKADLAMLPDEHRVAMLQVCESDRDAKASEHRAKAALLAEKRSAAPDADKIEQLRGRVARLENATANNAKKIDALKTAIANLEGKIEVAGGGGLGERAAGLRVQQQMALAEVERHNERVATLTLLRDVVESSYARRREQLNAPLRRHLKPFLNDVFPQAEIELGGNFAVAGLKRSGPGAELFGRLSAGTQEQVAVLVRLAMGSMICEKGADVPVILDDALVFSDDDRIEQMFDAINRAGRNQQVIVFTCRARSFASLGGRQLQIV